MGIFMMKHQCEASIQNIQHHWILFEAHCYYGLWNPSSFATHHQPRSLSSCKNMPWKRVVGPWLRTNRFTKRYKLGGTVPLMISSSAHAWGTGNIRGGFSASSEKNACFEFWSIVKHAWWNENMGAPFIVRNLLLALLAEKNLYCRFSPRVCIVANT